jgi:hypothetical protein
MARSGLAAAGNARERAPLDGREDTTRERVLAGVEQLLAKLLRDSPPNARESPIWKTLNSPLVLTLVGGLVVGSLTAQWQARLDERQRGREARAELRDRRHGLIASFATEIVASMEYARAYRDRECWILENAMRPDARYDDGKLAAETRQVVESLREKYAARPTGDALCARIRGLFPASGDIHAEANRLDGILDRFMLAQSRAELAGRYGDADRCYQDLITLMELETAREARLEEP